MPVALCRIAWRVGDRGRRGHGGPPMVLCPAVVLLWADDRLSVTALALASARIVSARAELRKNPAVVLRVDPNAHGFGPLRSFGIPRWRYSDAPGVI